MIVLREVAPRDVGHVRMINIAASDQPDEAFMARIIDPAPMPGAVGVARYRPEFDAVV